MTGPFDGAEDLSAFFVDGEHAESVVIAAAGGDVTVVGAFFESFSDDEGIDSSDMIFQCALADIGASAQGDVLTRDDDSAYTIRDIQPDGTGLVNIVVHGAR